MGASSKYKGIYEKPNKGWVGTKIPLGKVYARPADAARRLMQILRERPATRPGPGSRLAAAARRSQGKLLEKTKNEKLLPRLLATRIRNLRRVFDVPGSEIYPPDMVATKEHVVKSASMFKAEPTFEIVSFSIKYGPFKDNILEAWRCWGSPGAPDLNDMSDDAVTRRAKTLRDILVRTVVLTNKKPIAKAWVDNAGRKVVRHMGGAMTLKTLGIVKKATSSRNSLRLFLHHTHLTQKWSIVDNKEAVSSSITKLKQLVRGWAAIRRAVTQAPTTCDEWVRSLRAALAALRDVKHPVPLLPRQPVFSKPDEQKYLTMWTLRALFTHLRWKEHCEPLPIGGVRVSTLLRMCPDQSAVLKRIFVSVQRNRGSAAELLSASGLENTQVEHASMWACFACDSSLDGVRWDDYEVSDWVRRVQKYIRTHEMNPHLWVIARTTQA